MELSDKQVIMITKIDDRWTWKFVRAGDHGVVADFDGESPSRDEAAAAGLRAHPGAEIMDVDNPSAAY